MLEHSFEKSQLIPLKRPIALAVKERAETFLWQYVCILKRALTD